MSGDAMAVLPYYHDDLTLIWPGDHRLAGTYVGQQQSLDALIELQLATNRVPVKVEQILAGPDSVVAMVEERWTDPADPDKSLQHLRALEFTVADNRLRTCRIFESAQPAIDQWLQA